MRADAQAGVGRGGKGRRGWAKTPVDPRLATQDSRSRPKQGVVGRPRPEEPTSHRRSPWWPATEAVECVRDDALLLDHEADGKPIGLPIEIADVVIRCLDLAGGLGIDLEEIIAEKVAFNRGRKHRHGGKLL